MPAMAPWVVAVLLLAALVLFIVAFFAKPWRHDLVAAGLACWMLTLAWAAWARL
jgi:ABC-type uncharacterized transport system permease subunit